ncbi:hypothetical protein SEUCBS140593_005402 [Sporothrix eucalyptigena]|uniref:Dihydroceramidase n=1 Tax=Sporothrix eucalyptigena TaxID=1812306 RepID=A0ABP0BVZ0_9PEZI
MLRTKLRRRTYGNIGTQHSADFCEEDYAVSFYLAEFINSLTNLAYIYYALRYMYGRGSRGLFAPKVDFMAVSLLLLGIGSFVFHASLRQTMQFADELAMLGLTWSLLLGSLNLQSQSSTRDRLIKGGLAVVFPLFAAFYLWTGNILYHTIAFGTVLGLVVLRGYYVFYRRVPAFPEHKLASWRPRGRLAFLYLIVAFALWNIDLELCPPLRMMRAAIGLPWAWLLELHGWWHVLTAMSADMAMALVREVREELANSKAERNEKKRE